MNTLQNKTTDAEEILSFIKRLCDKSEGLSIDTANKLACVINEYPDGTSCSKPHPSMSPIFYDMYKVLKNIENYLDSVQKSINDAELPFNYNTGIGVK
jgi:hypothetical protein